ncbi:hypothetical protein C8Q80DRAFT_1208463 [Daedaleopsis nitida]|nr:hypothetical protein C8Q80DRAFT_1208463 [Daedaleopsis nitida]
MMLPAAYARFLGLTLLATLAYVLAAPSTPEFQTRFNWARTKYVYAFGDSYSFVSGTQGYPRWSFIGSALNFSYTPEQLLEDEIQLNITGSDGANWLEYLTGCFEGKPSECAPRQLWDFAFSGADVDKKLLPLHHEWCVDLVDQVNEWTQYGFDVIPHPPGETLTTFWIGINDTGDTVHNTTLDFKAFWELEMQSLFKAVQNLYDHELRGAYLFVTLPPLERSPDHIGTSIAPLYGQNIKDYNTALLKHSARFAETHRDVHVMTFDAHELFYHILDNAEQYHFTNITGFCECSDPEYFWFNTGHPTARVHKLLAEAVDAELRRASQD